MTRKTALLTSAGALSGLGAWMAASRRKRELNLRGRVVLITGGSRGLGLQLAREFASEGCTIAICARDPEELDRARQDLEPFGVRVHTVVCDVTNQEAVQRMVEEVTQRFWYIDILVNNAGVIRVGPSESMDTPDFQQAMDVMFWGTLYPILAVLPQMRKRREGRIVNITSIGGKVSVPHLLPYSCAKFATVALSEGLTAELAGEGIKVTTVIPGLMRTGSHLHAEFKGKQSSEFAWFSLGAATPLFAMSAERAARAIVGAVKRGDRERILSVSANVLARLHGLAPELTVPILGLVNRIVLPNAEGGSDEVIDGTDAERQLNSKIHRGMTAMGRAAAERLNEVQA